MVGGRLKTRGEDFETFEDAMDEQREELLETLAEDLGGNSEDDRLCEKPAPDGGEN